ncbi:MAG TPA: FecR domain-containing protein [Burkholderiales bacterium]|nr:FecR domain-containing protein [Burkholderiales bacterium]
MTKVSTIQRHMLVFGLLLLAAAWWCSHALADDAGRIKVSKGDVKIERDGKLMAAPVGTVVEVSDVVRTGADGSVGITFHDNSLLSAGPNSELVVEKFVFDSTTHQGEFDTRLRKGTLAVVSGKIVKQSPEAMRIKTPAAIMGVRGTEFVVKVDEPAAN